jgi:hypothetical protein
VRGYRYDLPQFLRWFSQAKGSSSRLEKLSILDLISYRQHLVNIDAMAEIYTAQLKGDFRMRENFIVSGLPFNACIVALAMGFIAVYGAYAYARVLRQLTPMRRRRLRLMRISMAIHW